MIFRHIVVTLLMLAFVGGVFSCAFWCDHRITHPFVPEKPNIYEPPEIDPEAPTQWKEGSAMAA